MNMSRNTKTTNSNNQACAACKFRRRKCDSDCILAPYFPHDRQQQFLNAHKLFGVKKITKIIENLNPHNQDEAMRTIIYESEMRAKDPVGGCCRYIQQLQSQIEYHRAELEFVLQQLAIFRAQTHHHPEVINTAPSHYHYFQQQLPQQELMMAQENHNNNNVIPLQENVNAWVMHDSMSLSSFSLQNNGGGSGFGDDLYQDLKSSSTMLDRNELGIEHEGLVDRSDETVLLKIDKAVVKGEADCIQQVEDHDQKGAATLFTLTNCTGEVSS